MTAAASDRIGKALYLCALSLWTQKCRASLLVPRMIQQGHCGLWRVTAKVADV